GDFTTSSYIAFTDTEQIVGDRAKNQASANPYNTIFHAHRLIGHKIFDPFVQENLHRWPFCIISDENGSPNFLFQYKNETKEFTPEKVLGLILKYLKKQSENYIGEFVKDAVISVPTCFNYIQRQAIKDAAKNAGLNVLKLISSTNAAALAYCFGKKENDNAEKNILIFDLGGGNLNVSILTIDGKNCAVESVAKNSHSGGEDFDYKIIKYFVEEFKQKHRKDISSNPRVLCRLKNACEAAKCTLSSLNQAIIKFSKPIILSNGNGKSQISTVDFSTNISREKFEELCAEQFRSILEIVETALKNAKMGKDEIDEILLIGSSTKIPKIQNLLSEFFNGKTLNTSLKRDEAVAYGAAIEAAILSGDKHQNLQSLSVLDVIPFSLGIESAEEPGEKLSAKQKLLNYCFNIKQCLENIKKDKNSEENCKKIIGKCDETLFWTYRNPNLSKRKYKNRRKEIQNIWNPIISQCY
uniref:Heat shock protein 70 n=1 Tax=Panagrolaimus sp. PS1159 TaxID=55785 RepID=A0AC35EUY8_9BILA